MKANKNLKNLLQFMDLAANKLGFTTEKEIEDNFEEIVIEAHSLMISAASKIIKMSRALQTPKIKAELLKNSVRTIK